MIEIERNITIKRYPFINRCANGIKLATLKMKKILLLFAFLGCIAFTVSANHPDNPPIDDNEGVLSDNCEGSIKVTFLSATSTTMELLVEASDALNDFCNYFDNSWADIGLSVYCTFAKTGVYGECIIYKAFKAMCGINGVVRLTMEGDISGAIKKGIKTGTQIYSIVKQSRTAFAITEAMCTVEDKKNN